MGPKCLLWKNHIMKVIFPKCYQHHKIQDSHTGSQTLPFLKTFNDIASYMLESHAKRVLPLLI